MSSDTTTTTVANNALSLICDKRLSDSGYDSDTSIEALRCRQWLHPCRLSLLRMFDWPFAVTRKTLTGEIDSPNSEWDYSCVLPSDFIRLINDYDTDDSNYLTDRWTIENGRILSNASSIYLVYIRDEDDPTKMDDLFIDAWTTYLAVKLSFALPGTGTGIIKLRAEIKSDLDGLLRKAKVSAWRETDGDSSGRSSWIWAQLGNNTLYDRAWR